MEAALLGINFTHYLTSSDSFLTSYVFPFLDMSSISPSSRVHMSFHQMDRTEKYSIQPCTAILKPASYPIPMYSWGQANTERNARMEVNMNRNNATKADPITYPMTLLVGQRISLPIIHTVRKPNMPFDSLSFWDEESRQLSRQLPG
jgi:hypothetical protein